MSEKAEFSKELAHSLIKKDYQIGDTETFLYKSSNNNIWEITIRREENIYLPFKFALKGQKLGTNETFDRRYCDIKNAVLHIVNDFNENARIQNTYDNLEEFLNIPPAAENHREFDYMMLDRLRSDCDYFLGNGNGYLGHLYYKDVNKHIEEMKKIYNSFSEEEKPEWISLEDIDNYQDRMTEMLEKEDKEI